MEEGDHRIKYTILMEDKSKKICVVDDDSSIGEVLTVMLELEGFNVNAYNAGRDGVEGSKKERPDLVLLDYFLPGEKAEDIIKGFRENFGSSLPIILMSASRQAEQFAEKLDVNEFIAKPFQREGLLDAIGRNLN